MIMIRAIVVLIEILCFYQILRGINGFKATENFVYIFTNKQWTRWGSILSLFGYVIGISILWYYYADLASDLHHVGTLLIPIIIVTVWRTGIKKMLFTFLLFFLVTALPMIVLYSWLSLPTVMAQLFCLFFIITLVELKVVYKILHFVVKWPILLYSWYFAAVLLVFASLFASWHDPRNALFVFAVVSLFTFIAIYSVKKYNEKLFINSLKEQTYSEIKAKLERQSVRVIKTEQLDLYELQSFWFSKRLSQTLKQEVKRLGLTVDIIKEGEQIKIHLFKFEVE